MDGSPMRRSVQKRLTRMTAIMVSAVAGLLAGLSGWSIMAPQVLPDLSEKPSIISYYTMHQHRAGSHADRR